MCVCYVDEGNTVFKAYHSSLYTPIRCYEKPPNPLTTTIIVLLADKYVAFRLTQSVLRRVTLNKAMVVTRNKQSLISG